MNAVLPLSHYSLNHVFLQDQVVNTVMDDGKFRRIIYSDALCAMNGIFLAFQLQVLYVEKAYNKFKCVLERPAHLVHTHQPQTQHSSSNDSTIQTLMQLERELLAKCATTLPGKVPIYRITDQLSNGFLKVFHVNPIIHTSLAHSNNNSEGSSAETLLALPVTTEFILKIYGIWENDHEFGLTYKVNDTFL
jgi:hypothetical protein